MKTTNVITYVEDVYAEPSPVDILDIAAGLHPPKPVHIGKRNMQATVTVEVDMEAIAKTLGAKAARSKGGKAAYLNGLVIVKRVESKPV